VWQTDRRTDILPRHSPRYAYASRGKNHSILMKFCTQQQILNSMKVAWSKMKKLHWTDSEFDIKYFLFSLFLQLRLSNYFCFFASAVFRRTGSFIWCDIIPEVGMTREDAGSNYTLDWVSHNSGIVIAMPMLTTTDSSLHSADVHYARSPYARSSYGYQQPEVAM